MGCSNHCEIVGIKVNIHNRDNKVGKQFTSVARSTGIEELKTPYNSQVWQERRNDSTAMLVSS